MAGKEKTDSLFAKNRKNAAKNPLFSVVPLPFFSIIIYNIEKFFC